MSTKAAFFVLSVKMEEGYYMISDFTPAKYH